MKKIILIFLFGATQLYAQQGNVASGGEATGNGTVSYSIGQVNYITATSNGTITQGLQQPYEILTVGVSNEKEIGIDVSLYPNPTVDYLTLSIETNSSEKYSYSLFDALGKMIDKKEINNPETKISLSDLPAAAYFINVFNGEKKVKVFKVIKNK